MSGAQVFLGILAIIVGVLGAWRNVTGLALFMAWLVIQLFWVTSHTWSTDLQFVCDIAVIAIMLVKPDYKDGFPYRCVKDQFVSLFWTERTPCDRVVSAVFPLVWITYVLPVSDYYRWWGLWWLAVIQFIAAGVEPTRLWITAMRIKRCDNKALPRVEMTGLADYA